MEYPDLIYNKLLKGKDLRMQVRQQDIKNHLKKGKIKIQLIVCGFKINPSPGTSILNEKKYPDPICERFSHAYL